MPAIYIDPQLTSTLQHLIDLHDELNVFSVSPNPFLPALLTVPEDVTQDDLFALRKYLLQQMTVAEVTTQRYITSILPRLDSLINTQRRPVASPYRTPPTYDQTSFKAECDQLLSAGWIEDPLHPDTSIALLHLCSHCDSQNVTATVLIPPKQQPHRAFAICATCQNVWEY